MDGHIEEVSRQAEGPECCHVAVRVSWNFGLFYLV